MPRSSYQAAESRKDRNSLEFTAPSRCKLNALYELHHLLTSPVVYSWGGEAGNDYFFSLSVPHQEETPVCILTESSEGNGFRSQALSPRRFGTPAVSDHQLSGTELYPKMPMCHMGTAVHCASLSLIQVGSGNMEHNHFTCKVVRLCQTYWGREQQGGICLSAQKKTFPCTYRMQFPYTKSGHLST